VTESVPRHCNPILLKTPEEAIDRLATDSDHHCQILLRQAPTLSLSGGRDDLRTSTIPARAGEWASIAKNDQALDRDMQVIADHSDKCE